MQTLKVIRSVTRPGFSVEEATPSLVNFLQAKTKLIRCMIVRKIKLPTRAACLTQITVTRHSINSFRARTKRDENEFNLNQTYIKNFFPLFFFTKKFI